MSVSYIGKCDYETDNKHWWFLHRDVCNNPYKLEQIYVFPLIILFLASSKNLYLEATLLIYSMSVFINSGKI